MENLLSVSIAAIRATLNKSPSASLRTDFDKLRTNGKYLIPFVVSLSNHKANPLVQRFLGAGGVAFANPEKKSKAPIQSSSHQ